ncbi:MAG: hypothetical protein IKK75_05520 [Clostridia bacterium]|nr:hypothetical protein [Clostridia bacterium]
MRKRFIRIFVLLIMLLWCAVPSGALGEEPYPHIIPSLILSPDTGYTAYEFYFEAETKPVIIYISFSDENDEGLTQDLLLTDDVVLTHRDGDNDERVVIEDLSFLHHWSESERQYVYYVYSADRTLCYGPLVHKHNFKSKEEPWFCMRYFNNTLWVNPILENYPVSVDLYRIADNGTPELFVSDVPVGYGWSDPEGAPGHTYTYYLVAKDGKGAGDKPLSTISITIPEATAP